MCTSRNRPAPQGQHRVHHVVTHDYHDHSHEVDDGLPEPVARGGVTTAFPIKLHEMLDKIEKDGYGHVVSYQPHGRCFVVHKPKEFVDHIMPTYFRQSKFPSFQRQLNLYGFQRLTKGADKGGYYHELFLRDRIFLSHRIQRMRVKGTGVRARSNPTMEPNFYKMDPVSNTPPIAKYSPPVMTTLVAPAITPKLPPLEIPSNAFDDHDVIADFEGREFHLLDLEVCEQKFSEQGMQSFLNKINISRDLYNDIIKTEDDEDLFGDLIQRIIE